MVKHLDHQLSQNLATNLKYIRMQRGSTQQQLARQSDVPRSTIATLEVGDGNPTLSVMARLSLSLGVSIEELLSTPRARCQLFPAGSLPSQKRARGRALVASLLPDPVPGMAFERLELEPGAQLVGVPHRPGTREYLCCAVGEITLRAAGERFEVGAGDVVAFQGDQKHSYHNDGRSRAIGYSVVALVPIPVGRTQGPHVP